MLGGSVTECDLIVKGSVGGEPRGWLLNGYRRHVPRRRRRHDQRRRAARAAEHRGPLTYTCAPPGSGTRMGIDRDETPCSTASTTARPPTTTTSSTATPTASADVCDGDDDGDGFLDAVETDTGVS